MCPHCEMTVKKALEELSFVETATASHEAGTVEMMLSGVYDEAAVRDAVTAKGYEYKGDE